MKCLFSIGNEGISSKSLIQCYIWNITLFVYQTLTTTWGLIQVKMFSYHTEDSGIHWERGKAVFCLSQTPRKYNGVHQKKAWRWCSSLVECPKLSHPVTSFNNRVVFWGTPVRTVLQQTPLFADCKFNFGTFRIFSSNCIMGFETKALKENYLRWNHY